MKLLKRLIPLVIMCVAVGFIAACGDDDGGGTNTPSGSAGGSPSAGGTLVFAMPFEVASLDPHRANEETSEITLGNVYDTLIQIDPADPTKIVPRLATDWKVENNNTVLTFTIRDAKFSTGNPVTANDVKFSLERLHNLQGSPAFILDGMKTVDVVDPHTVRITLDKSDAPFLAKLAFTPVAIIDSTVAKAHGAVSDSTAVDSDAADEYISKNSIGSGAFILDSYVPDSEIVLTRNPNYWGDVSNVDKVILRNMPEPATQRQALERGDIDIAWTLDVTTAEDLKGKQGINVDFVPSINTLYMFLTNNPDVSKPISNTKVRLAIQRSLDYDGILALINGHGQRPPTTIPYGLLGADTVEPVKEDLTQARQLLTEAGYPDGFEVNVEYKQLVRFNVDYSLLMQKVQADLARVGIKINLQPETGTVFLDNYRAGKLAMSVSDWAPDYVDPDDYVAPFWSSETAYLTKRIAYQNTDVDKLTRDGLAETDPAKRKEIYRQLQELFLKDANFFTLLQPNFILASRDRVQGYRLVYELRQVDFSKISLTN